jgi:hypothetical protein
MAEKGGQNEQRTPPLESLEVDDGADTSQSDKFTMKGFLTKAVLLVIIMPIQVVLVVTVITCLIGVMTCFAGHVCILYGLYFRGKEEKLRKEYVDAGIGLEGFVVSCVPAKYDESGALYDCTIQYAAPDSTACYALTIPSGRKEYHVNEQVQIVVLFGIPQSGRLASACESSDSICGIRCFSLVFGSFWAPLMSILLAGTFFNFDISNMDSHVIRMQMLTVFCVMLVIPCHVVFLFASKNDPAGQRFALRPGFQRAFGYALSTRFEHQQII